MKRKTTSVAALLWMVNYFLEHSKPEQKGERQGHINLMSIVLHDTGNYSGFNYLNLLQKDSDGNYVIEDSTRVFFYISSNIKEEYKQIEQEKKLDH